MVRAKSKAGPGNGRKEAAPREPRPSAEEDAADAAVSVAHDRAISRTREASAAAQRIAATTAKQRAAAETLADRAHAVTTRAQELSASFTRITDAFERLSLVALNAGLEGARLGEVAGKALLLVSDEVRSHASRGADNARELSTTLGEVAAEVTRLHGNIGQLRQASGELSQDAGLVASASVDAERALTEMAAQVRARSGGEDPETLRAVNAACDQARALAASVGALDGKVSRQSLAKALHPVLEPLAKLLATSGRAAHEA